MSYMLVNNNNKVNVTRRDKTPHVAYDQSEKPYKNEKVQLLQNLHALGFDFSTLSAADGEFFSFDSLDKPSRKIFEIVIYFLFKSIDQSYITDLFKNNFPNTTGKKGAIEFRKITFSLIDKVRERNPQVLIPKVSSTLLMSPGGPDAVHLLFKLSNLALFVAIDGYKDSENCLPVIACKGLGNIQLKSLQTMALDSNRNIHLQAASNDQMEKEMRTFYHEQMTKKLKLQQKKEALLCREQGLSRQLEEKENKKKTRIDFELQELKSTVHSFWQLLFDAVELTESNFDIICSTLAAAKSDLQLNGADLHCSIPAVLLNRFQNEIFKEIGTTFINKGRVDITKLSILCSFALELVGDKWESMKQSNLMQPCDEIERLLALRNTDLEFLAVLRSRLEEHEKIIMKKTKVLEKEFLDSVSAEEYEECGFMSQLQMKETIPFECHNNSNQSLDTSQIKNDNLFGSCVEEQLSNCVITNPVRDFLSPSFVDRWNESGNKIVLQKNRSVSKLRIPQKYVPKNNIPCVSPSGLVIKVDQEVDFSASTLVTNIQPITVNDESSSVSSVEEEPVNMKADPIDKLVDMITDSIIISSDDDGDCADDYKPSPYIEEDITQQLQETAFIPRDKIQRTPEKLPDDEPAPPTAINETSATISSGWEGFSRFDLTDTSAVSFGISLLDEDITDTTATFLNCSLSSGSDNETSAFEEIIPVRDIGIVFNNGTHANVREEQDHTTTTQSPEEVSLMFFGSPEAAATPSAVVEDHNNTTLTDGGDTVTSMEYQKWMDNCKRIEQRKEKRRTRRSWYKLVPE